MKFFDVIFGKNKVFKFIFLVIKFGSSELIEFYKLGGKGKNFIIVLKFSVEIVKFFEIIVSEIKEFNDKVM